MSKKFKQIQEIVQSLEVDVDKFYNKGVKTAGTRIRKAMQEIKLLAQELRKEIQSKKQK